MLFLYLITALALAVSVAMDRRKSIKALLIARSDYFPTLSLDANYTYSGETTSELQGSSYIGAGISFPLFSGFARPARVAQENWALKNLTQQQQGLHQQISLEVWNAFLGVKEANERIMNAKIFYEYKLYQDFLFEFHQKRPLVDKHT